MTERLAETCEVSVSVRQSRREAACWPKLLLTIRSESVIQLSHRVTASWGEGREDKMEDTMEDQMEDKTEDKVVEKMENMRKDKEDQREDKREEGRSRTSYLREQCVLCEWPQ